MADFVDRSIFTVRPPSEGGGFRGEEAERISLIHKLRGLNPAYIDVELRTLAMNEALLQDDSGTGTIVSWHDQIRTPGRARLLAILAKAAAYRGLAKVVTMAKVPSDNLTVLSLYDEPGPPPIAFCMGGPGVFSRVMAISRGSPITYASLPGEPTAPGQLSIVQLLALRRRLQGD